MSRCTEKNADRRIHPNYQFQKLILLFKPHCVGKFASSMLSTRKLKKACLRRLGSHLRLDFIVKKLLVELGEGVVGAVIVQVQRVQDIPAEGLWSASLAHRAPLSPPPRTTTAAFSLVVGGGSVTFHEAPPPAGPRPHTAPQIRLCCPELEAGTWVSPTG